MSSYGRASLGWLVWRELAVISRTPAMWVGACGYLVLLVLFLVIWGDGVPGFAGSVLDQYDAVRLALVTAVLPWLACRLTGASIRDLDRVSTLAPCTPRQFVVSQVFAVWVTLIGIELLALPLTVIAARISAVEVDRLISGFVPAIALCTWIAASASAASLTLDSPLTRWLIVTAAAIAVRTALPDSSLALASLFIASAAVAFTATASANRRAREDRRREPARPRQDAYVL